jgi:S1-C subfamily serine protease
LRQLKNLRTLTVLYCPIGDAAVESLGAMGGLAALRLYGTGVTTEGKDQLVQSLRGTRVDVRRGAFLGIGCDPTQPGCVIYTVRPNTAAEKAGLQIGDLIEKYEAQPVQNFEELTAAIARNGPGDVVSVEIVRGDETLTKQLKLGDWELVE